MTSDEWIEVGGQRFTPDQLRRLLHGSSGVPMWLLAEAAASVALDRDSRARTVSLEPLTAEQADTLRGEQEDQGGDGGPHQQP